MKRLQNLFSNRKYWPGLIMLSVSVPLMIVGAWLINPHPNTFFSVMSWIAFGAYFYNSRAAIPVYQQAAL